MLGIKYKITDRLPAYRISENIMTFWNTPWITDMSREMTWRWAHMTNRTDQKPNSKYLNSSSYGLEHVKFMKLLFLQALHPTNS